MNKILVTGGCGFVGSNLVIHGMNSNYELHVLDNLSRDGSKKNLETLKNIGNFKFYNIDIRNKVDVYELIKNIKPIAIFHLAGQVAMKSSIENPRNDFEVNVLGTINILEAVRLNSPKSYIIYSSSNKVYGDLEYLKYVENDLRYSCVNYPKGFSEKLNLDFHSPYGCSKGSADQYLLDYHRIYGLNTVVFRHSTMYGGMQHANEFQGWIGWFIHQAIKTKYDNKNSFTISGNGKQVRDVLHAKDVVSLYYSCLDNKKIIGHAFNIGGGYDQSLSLLELFNFLEKHLNLKLNYQIIEKRASDQKFFVSDNVKIKKFTGWVPLETYNDGIIDLLNE